MEYSYPIDVDWSQEEILQVVEFFNHIEDAYENHLNKHTKTLRKLFLVKQMKTTCIKNSNKRVAMMDTKQ